ncbi:MAG: TonB family protein, partial [Pseudomonadota bacterium]|nr:TonB family protein [Pseudomonadota bacterium]
GGSRRAAAAAPADDDEVVSTRDTRSKAFYFASHEHAQTPQQLEPRTNAGIAANDDGIELRLRGEPTREHWVSADTREADVAVYLDGWRRKIERVGTMNFPDAARRRKLSGTPVIEVTIGADGTLLQTVVRHSSGHAQIDEAAMRILALAAPYDAFPAALSAKHDRIRIAYEWQFLGGAAHGTGALFSR